MLRTFLRTFLLVPLAALAGCSFGPDQASIVRSSCPDPIEGFAELVDELADQSELFPSYELIRRGPDRIARSESRFACEAVTVDVGLDTLVQYAVIEYYLTEEDAIIGFRYSEVSEYDDAVGFIDSGFPRRIEGSWSQSRHHDGCIVIRTLWRNELALTQAPAAPDRDELIREAFPSIASLCQTDEN